MKRKIFFLAILLLSFSCGKDSPSNEIPNEDPTSETPDDGGGTTPINSVEVIMAVDIPQGSVVSQDDLLVSSLQTEAAPVVGGESTVNVFDSQGYEISFAEDAAGNIVLMNYFKPSDNSAFDLNATTTATAMIMLQPWVTDLTVEAKGELVAALGSYQEFQGLIQAIETSLTSDGIPLQNTDVIAAMNALIDIILEDPNPSGKGDVFYGPPILLTATDDGNLLLENESSMTYGIQINDDQRVILPGVDKSLFTIVGGVIYELASGNDILKTDITVNKSNDGLYSINANNGLGDLQEANQTARYDNIGSIVLVLLELASAGLVENLPRASCGVEIGKLVLQGSPILSSKNSKELTTNIISSLEQSTDAITECAKAYSSDPEALSEAVLGKVLKTLSGLSVASKALRAGILAKDYFFYENNIDFCVEREQGTFNPCQPLMVPSKIDFGTIPKDGFATKVIEIKNTTGIDLTITDAQLPDTLHVATVPILKGLNLPAGETKQVLVSHERQNYEGPLYNNYNESIIVLTTDILGAESVNIELTGNYKEALEVRDINGEVTGSISFGSIINNTTFTSSISAINVTDYPTTIWGPESQSSSEVYTFNWTETELQPGDALNIDVQFAPQNEQDYTGSLTIKSNYGQSLPINIFGSGVPSTLTATFEDGSADIGQTAVGSPLSKTFQIINVSLRQPVTITGITSSNPAFTIDTSNTLTTLDPFLVNPQGTTAVITFNPDVAGPLNSEITITTDIGEPVVVQVSGEGTIFGNWTITGSDSCESSDGTIFSDDYTAQVTLNEDYTVTAPNDSNGNYLTNYFTFENNELVVVMSYQDFFSPSCDGQNYQVVDETWTFSYDPSTNSFSGSIQSSANTISGSDCSLTGRTCTGTAEMVR